MCYIRIVPASSTSQKSNFHEHEHTQRRGNQSRAAKVGDGLFGIPRGSFASPLPVNDGMNEHLGQKGVSSNQRKV